MRQIPEEEQLYRGVQAPQRKAVSEQEEVTEMPKVRAVLPRTGSQPSDAVGSGCRVPWLWQEPQGAHFADCSLLVLRHRSRALADSVLQDSDLTGLDRCCRLDHSSLVWSATSFAACCGCRALRRRRVLLVSSINAKLMCRGPVELVQDTARPGCT